MVPRGQKGSGVPKDDKVMALVQRTLNRKPTTTSGELYERAMRLNSEIGKLSVRQFHAQYTLQVMKARAKGRRRAKAGPGRGGVPTDVPRFLERQLEERLEDLETAIRGDFTRVLEKDSLQEAAAFMTRIGELQGRWNRKKRAS